MKKHIKEIIISLFVDVVVIIVSIVGVVQDYQDKIIQMMKYKQSTNDTTDTNDLDGLPAFITLEMMEAFFEVQEMKGIPVSTGLAQLIAESGFGTYGPGGESGQGLSGLAYTCKNLFGIKYSSSDLYATGSKNFSTGEQTSTGNSYTITAGFSIYSDYTSCIRQRAVMLERERYASRTSAYLNRNDGNYTKEDARNFMEGIRAGGWATDVSYTQKCIGHMDTYNLYQYDNMNWEEYQIELQDKSDSDIVIAGNGTFCNPCPGATYISSTFGYRAWDNSYHKGIDYAAPAGTPTYAADGGKVITAGWSNSAGNWVVIDHGNGFVTKYMHHSSICVRVGDTVVKGQRIGSVGTTGYSSGNHLHFQAELNYVAVDPTNYM